MSWLCFRWFRDRFCSFDCLILVSALLWDLGWLSLADRLQDQMLYIVVFTKCCFYIPRRLCIHTLKTVNHESHQQKLQRHTHTFKQAAEILHHGSLLWYDKTPVELKYIDSPCLASIKMSGDTVYMYTMLPNWLPKQCYKCFLGSLKSYWCTLHYWWCGSICSLCHDKFWEILALMCRVNSINFLETNLICIISSPHGRTISMFHLRYNARLMHLTISVCTKGDNALGTSNLCAWNGTQNSSLELQTKPWSCWRI